MRVSHGNLIVGMTNCDTSHRDETLFNATGATGAYDLNLQVLLYAGILHKNWCSQRSVEVASAWNKGWDGGRPRPLHP